ncbi:MAG: hypothetical protein ACXWCX_15850, partial [Burkholderiales bacterium]
MGTRREFMKNAVGAVASIAFTGCAMQGQQTRLQTRMNGRRREVVVNGRRVKTVDVHAHCVIPEAMALMGRKVAPAGLDMARDRLACGEGRDDGLRRVHCHRAGAAARAGAEPAGEAG